jgi:hypothetical protein
LRHPEALSSVGFATSTWFVIAERRQISIALLWSSIALSAAVSEQQAVCSDAIANVFFGITGFDAMQHSTRVLSGPDEVFVSRSLGVVVPLAAR